MSTINPGNPEPGATHPSATIIRPNQPPVAFLQRPVVCTLVVALLIGIGIVRIVSTYHVFNHTIDEDAHLACGIQWFQNAYTYDPKHTPLARISIALLPYLDGVRGYGDPSYWQEGVLELSSGGHYWRNLTLARIGVLPYFALSPSSSLSGQGECMAPQLHCLLPAFSACCQLCSRTPQL